MKSFLHTLVGLLVLIAVSLPATAQIGAGVNSVLKAEERAMGTATRQVVASTATAGKGACYWALHGCAKQLQLPIVNPKSLETAVAKKVQESAKPTNFARKQRLAVAGGTLASKQGASPRDVSRPANVQRTLVLIKPDAIEQRITGVILDRLDKLGLEMVGAKVVSVTEDLIRTHYKHLAGTPFVDNVVDYMMGKYNNISNHKIYAFVFQGEDAVAKVRAEIGSTNPEKADPNSIRGSYGRTVNGIIQNCVHASGTPEEGEDEITLWFRPDEILSF